ncbi:MAG TPA: hypothetical protein K8W06_02390 [Limosilactobacillus coleohominis]|nr:hypothetical protein [Limosilactobacillus coleohominis]
MDGLIAYFQNCLEIVSNLITSLGIVTVALNIRKFRNDVDAHRKQDEQILIQNSINVLRKFAEQIIPEAKRKQKQFEKLLEIKKCQIVKEKNLTINDLDENEAIQEMIEQLKWDLKDRCGFNNIFNEFEQVTVYMNYNMVKQNLVYVPLHKFLIDFVENNMDYFCRIRTSESPFINTTQLYNNWKLMTIKNRRNN